MIASYVKNEIESAAPEARNRHILSSVHRAKKQGWRDRLENNIGDGTALRCKSNPGSKGREKGIYGGSVIKERLYINVKQYFF